MNEIIICKKQRIKYLDIARGIAIILMIVGHVVSGKKRNIIFSFHMPLFIIISGMFFKTERTLKEEILNIIKKLIVPYFITVIITYIFNLLFFCEKESIINIVKQIMLAYSNKKTFFLVI